jgi:hypothetical protein
MQLISQRLELCPEYAAERAHPREWRMTAVYLVFALKPIIALSFWILIGSSKASNNALRVVLGTTLKGLNHVDGYDNDKNLRFHRTFESTTCRRRVATNPPPRHVAP